jgi:hypothetical protein
VILYEDSSIYKLAVTKDIYESKFPKDSQMHTVRYFTNDISEEEEFILKSKK